ncbi:MAG: PAS domain-containing protein [Kiritimatiellae bacterium]|nr:PAS domain-containing protein [Kiritimatiellia bacterium]
MPPPTPQDELRKSILATALGVTALTLFLGLWFSHHLQRREAEARLDALLEVAAPLLQAEPPALPPAPDGYRFLRLDPSGRILLDSAPGESFHANGEVMAALSNGRSLTHTPPHLTLARSLRDETGALQGFAVTRTTLETGLGLREPHTLWIALASCALGVLAWVVMWNRSRPRLELLQATAGLLQGDVREPVRLHAGHPYRAVADTLNQLADSLERQSRVISEQHHRQQVLLNNISEGILVLDNELNITGINPIAAQWLETGHPARAQGNPLYKLSRNPTLLSMIDALLETGEMKEAHLSLDRPGEDPRIVQLRGSLLVDKDQTVGVLVLLRDVTTLRRLETLRQDFVANVSHELRTPLTSIKGYAELLEDETEDPEAVARYGGKILNQSTRMINIIDDLLALTRIENADAPSSIAPTEILPLIENVAQLCEDAAVRRNLRIEIDAPDTLQAPLHAPLFEQAVHNLVQNAIKYTHPHTTITIRAFPSGNECILEVEDQGPGIAPQHQSRLFERFYRVDKARSRAVGGTGLGLSLVKHILQLHHGSIEVESTPGQGATFRVRVPGC